MGLGVVLCGSICSGYSTKYLGLVGLIEFGNLGRFCGVGVTWVLCFWFSRCAYIWVYCWGLLWFGLQCILV